MEDRDQLMMVSGNLGLLKTLEPNHNRDHSRVKLIIKYLQCIPISKYLLNLGYFAFCASFKFFTISQSVQYGSCICASTVVAEDRRSVAI